MRNELRESTAEHKEKVQQLQYKLEGSRDELKHFCHVGKLEQAELRQHYENKLQKVHLEHRKDKELFLIEHDSQIMKLN